MQKSSLWEYDPRGFWTGIMDRSTIILVMRWLRPIWAKIIMSNISDFSDKDLIFDLLWTK